MTAATGRNPKVADNGPMAYSGSAKRRAWDIGRNCIMNRVSGQHIIIVRLCWRLTARRRRPLLSACYG